MNYKVDTPEEYLSLLPFDRQKAVGKIRNTLIENLPNGFEEQLSYGMLSYVVPLSIYPDGYHCEPTLPLPFINLASQKNHIALYHSGLYANKKLHNWFVSEYPKHARYKLDMGKSCIRFKKMSDIPFSLIAELFSKLTVEEWVAM